MYTRGTVESMTQTINQLAQTLGIPQQDLETLLTHRPPTDQPQTSFGGPMYAGSYYGTYSVHDHY